MSQNINDLRETLFDTLQGVKAGNIDLDRAKAISELSQNIINTAKVEIDYLKAGGNVVSGFMDIKPSAPVLTSGPQPVVTRSHRLK